MEHNMDVRFSMISDQPINYTVQDFGETIIERKTPGQIDDVIMKRPWIDFFASIIKTRHPEQNYDLTMVIMSDIEATGSMVFEIVEAFHTTKHDMGFDNTIVRWGESGSSENKELGIEGAITAALNSPYPKLHIVTDSPVPLDLQFGKCGLIGLKINMEKKGSLVLDHQRLSSLHRFNHMVCKSNPQENVVELSIASDHHPGAIVQFDLQRTSSINGQLLLTVTCAVLSLFIVAAFATWVARRKWLRYKLRKHYVKFVRRLPAPFDTSQELREYREVVDRNFEDNLQF
ncbi:hypothetical protein CRE_07577 [Caenorhabditis remanei]|uniref:Uncharacterized protein n=1 Tax=Caenorhabditis remanei TaxID=31234 RepID=E3MP28_CAERE|nr:hypothetical protein CRE_07577 [Caenorhabditis remanei]